MERIPGEVGLETVLSKTVFFYDTVYITADTCISSYVVFMYLSFM